MTSMTTVSTMRKDLRSLGGGKEEHLNSLLIFARLLTLLSLSLFLSVHKISTKTIQKQKRTNKITSHPSIDFAKVKRFALSVYDRADQRDRRKMFTKELVDAFDASAAFLYCLESQIFKPYKEQGCDFDEDLRQRAEYAEWRAYDVAMALRSGRKPTEVADAFDEDCSSGRELNAGLAGMSLAAAAPPPLDLPKDVLKQPEERPKCVAKEDKVEKEGEETKEVKKDVVNQEEQLKKDKEEPKGKSKKKKKGKKKASEVDVGGKDDDDVVSSRVATEKVSSDLKQSREQKEAPMFNGVTSTRHGDTDWIKIESKKTNQKFWFNEKTKEKTWEEPSNA